MSIFTERLQEMLNRQGMSQRDLADAIDKTEVSVSRYVNGQRVPKANVLLKMSQALNCQADYLIGNDSLFDCGSAVREEDRYGCKYCNIERKDHKCSVIPIDMGEFGNDYELAIYISELHQAIAVDFGEKTREPIIAVHSDKITYCPFCGRKLPERKK